MSRFHFLKDTSDIPDWEYGHRKRQCHYKKFPEHETARRSNMITTHLVYVHIRICQCHYDREEAPDRSQEIHNGHPKWPANEQNGIEFHLDPGCGWINVGSAAEPKLKRVCVTACGRYDGDP